MSILDEKFILITRSYEQSSSEIDFLKSNGAEVMPLPVIKLIPYYDSTKIEDVLNRFYEFDYLIFTSINAVRFFAGFVEKLGNELDLKNVKVVAIGAKTKDYCESNLFDVDLVPEKSSSKGIIDLLQKDSLSGKNILIPCSMIARTELKEELEYHRATVEMVPVYDNVLPDYDDVKDYVDYLDKNKPDIFIFTSPSNFTNYLELLKIDDIKEYFEGTVTASIGTTTRDVIEQRGIKVDIIPDKFDVISTVNELLDYFKKTVKD
jgi:uroporphyrinogen-III synthase